MSALILTVLAWLPGAQAQDEGTAFAAAELKVARSEGRLWKHASGYLARVVGTSAVTGDFILPEKLKPGKYFAFLKGTNGGGGVLLQLSCGKTRSAEFCPQDTDASGAWSDAVPVEIEAPTDSLTLMFKASSARVDPRQYIFQGLYLTPKAEVVVDRNDHVVRRSPSPLRAGPPNPSRGNLIPNGSFETGLGQGWQISVPNEKRDYSIRALWDPARAGHGAASVRLPPHATLISRVFRLRPGQKHTLSVKALTEAPSASLTLSIDDANAPGVGPRPASRGKNTFSAGREWQRFVLSQDASGAEMQVRIASHDQDLWIDEVQFEEGEPSGFRAKDPIEIGFVGDTNANLFFDDERAVLRLFVRNETDQVFAGKIRFDVLDCFDRRAKEGSLAVTVPARSTTQAALELGGGSRGIFRIVAWVDGKNGADEEASFAVVPRPRVAGRDRESMIGIHATASDFQYEVLKKLGVKWQRVMSPEVWFRWKAAEPERDKFVWFDAEARKTDSHGLEILGTLGSEWPRWADREGNPDLDAWERFVRAMVAHYKPWVRHWEVWNEPVHGFTAEAYAEIYRRGARAIRETDPTAKIIGMGGSYRLEWCLDVIRHLGGDPRSHMDFLSTHLYPEKADPFNPLSGVAAKGFHDRIFVPHKLDVWNTESGAWCLGFEKGANSAFRSPGPAVWPQKEAWRYYRGGDYEASRVACSFLHAIGSGFTRYFYYDSRFHTYHSIGRSHCTIFGVGDTVRAKGVAYAILAHLFDHSRGLGDVSPSKDTFAYLFDRRGTPLAGLFMADEADVRKRKTMTLSLDPRHFRAYDLMGNEIALSGSAVPYGRQPVYLEGRDGLTVDQLRAAIAGARVSDLADTIPPRISLPEGPRGELRDPSVRLRWIASDETSIPYDPAAQNAILYSFRLVGTNDEWSPWTPKTYADYDLKPGRYRFEVKAKDASGNVSETLARDFAIIP